MDNDKRNKRKQLVVDGIYNRRVLLVSESRSNCRAQDARLDILAMGVTESLARAFVCNNYAGVVDMRKTKQEANASQQSVERLMPQRYFDLVEQNEIDRDLLDESLVHMSQTYYEILMEEAYALSLRDELKTAADEIYSRVSADIRAQYEKKGDRYTEARLKEEATASNEYLDAYATYQDQALRTAYWRALTQAFDMRCKVAIPRLISLYESEYWSKSSAGKATAEAKDHNAKAAREGMRKLRNR